MKPMHLLPAKYIAICPVSLFVGLPPLEAGRPYQAVNEFDTQLSNVDGTWMFTVELANRRRGHTRQALAPRLFHHIVA